MQPSPRRQESATVPRIADDQPLQKIRTVEDVVLTAAGTGDENIVCFLAWLLRATVSWGGRDTIDISQRQILKGVRGIPPLDMSRETLRRVADDCERRGWIRRSVMTREVGDGGKNWFERVTRWSLCLKAIRAQGRGVTVRVVPAGEPCFERSSDALKLFEAAVGAASSDRLPRSCKAVLIFLATAAAVYETDGVRREGLHEALGIASSSMRRNLAGLEALGLIRREGDALRLVPAAVSLFSAPVQGAQNWATPPLRTRPYKKNPSGSNTPFLNTPLSLAGESEPLRSSRIVEREERKTGGKEGKEEFRFALPETLPTGGPTSISTEYDYKYFAMLNDRVDIARKGDDMPKFRKTAPVSTTITAADAAKRAAVRTAARRTKTGYEGFEIAYRDAMAENHFVRIGKLHGVEKGQLQRLLADFDVRYDGQAVEKMVQIVQEWPRIVERAFSWMTERPAPKAPKIGFILVQMGRIDETLRHLAVSPEQRSLEARVAKVAREQKISTVEAAVRLGRSMESRRHAPPAEVPAFSPSIVVQLPVCPVPVRQEPEAGARPVKSFEDISREIASW